jgi:hypothetical protein
MPITAEFSVRINRRDGIVEVDGSDKAWVAQQVQSLAVVYEAPLPDHVRVASPAAEPATLEQTQQTTTSAVASQRTTTPRRRSSSRSSTNRASRNPALEEALTPELRTALQAFVDERSGAWAAKTNQAPVIATFLMDNVNWGGWIDDSDLYTVYSIMGWPAPTNFRSQLNNGRSRNGYWGNWVEGRVQLTHAGEQYGRHGSKD